MMTGLAIHLVLQLVVRYDELENLKHGVPRATIVEVSVTQILFHWIDLKKLANAIYMWITALFVHCILRYQGGVESTPPQPISTKK